MTHGDPQTSLVAQALLLDLANSALDLAKRLGATCVGNPRYEDPAAAVRGVSGEEGTGIVNEVVGATSTIR